MAEDKLIKSGQLTLTRLVMLALAGGLIALFVARGGVWLTIGYFALTAFLCVLLFLIAIDYGVTMDKVRLQGQVTEGPIPDEATPAREIFRPTAAEPRPKRKGARPAKRRR